MHKFVIIIFTLLWLSVSGFSQCMNDLERAEKRAIVEANSEDAAEAANKLFVCYHLDGKIDSAKIYARKGINIGHQRQDSKIWIEAYHQLAVAHLDTPDLDSASYYFNLLLDKTEGAEERHKVAIRAVVYMYFGAMYQEHNLGYEEAFSYFNKAKEVSKKAEHMHVYVRSVIAQIEILLQRKSYDEINRLLTEAYEHIDKNDPEHSLALLNLNKEKAVYLVTTATTEAERKEGMELMLKVYEEADRDGWPKIKAMTFIDIAMHYAADMPEEKLVKMAEENFEVAKNKLMGSPKGGLYEAYAQVLMQTKQYKKAIPYLIVAKEHLSGAQHLGNYLAVCQNLIKAYEETDQLDKVVPEFHNYRVFRDSLEATVYSDQLLELEEKYKTEKKENENIQLQAQNNLIQSRFRYSSIIGSLLLVLLVTGLYLFLKLKKTKLELEELNQDKNKLFAILAHDLRNPISSLSNLAAKVKFLTENDRLNELDELAINTDAKLRALNDNLNNILLWAITESNLFGINPEKVSLSAEVNKINELYIDDIRQKEIVVHNKIPISNVVHTDLKVLQTVLRNLVNNAIKFSRPGGIIEISVEKEKTDLLLRIMDNGIGLENRDEDQKPSNMAIRRKAQGTGIGLKISKELAARVNLDLTLESNQKGGATGTVRFKSVA